MKKGVTLVDVCIVTLAELNPSMLGRSVIKSIEMEAHGLLELEEVEVERRDDDELLWSGHMYHMFSWIF